jgi:hypothetical protein
MPNIGGVENFVNMLDAYFFYSKQHNLPIEMSTLDL